jgi:hypothetical protein
MRVPEPVKLDAGIERLDREQATFDHSSGVNTSPGQIKMPRSNHVDPRTALEHPKILTNSRVAVVDLVLLVPLVPSPIDCRQFPAR